MRIFLQSWLKWFRQKVKWSTLLVMGVLLAISLVCERFWIVQYPGVLLMQYIDRERTPVEAQHVVIITITPEEYEKLFNNTSPLNATKLSETIDKILKLGPGVLGIDIDTSDKSFSQFPQTYLDKPIVWGRGVKLSKRSLLPGGFAGGEGPPWLMSGIALFERAPDWAIRDFDACVTIAGQQIPRFHYVIDRAFNGHKTYACESSERRHFPGVRYHFPELTLSELEQFAGDRQPGEENLLSNKIVLLGGVYSVADYHAGPNGSLIPGIELVASAVEAGLAEASWSEKWEIALGLLADAALGVLIIWLYKRRKLSGLVKLGVSLAIAAFVLFVPGVLLYYWAIWVVNPFPLVIGMIMHQMYEAAEGSEGAEKEEVVFRHTTTRISQEEVRVKRTEA